MKVPVGPEVFIDADGPPGPGQRPREATPPCGSPLRSSCGPQARRHLPGVAIRGAAVVGAGTVVTNNVALGIVMVETLLQPSGHDTNTDHSWSRDGTLTRSTAGQVTTPTGGLLHRLTGGVRQR